MMMMTTKNFGFALLMVLFTVVSSFTDDATPIVTHETGAAFRLTINVMPTPETSAGYRHSKFYQRNANYSDCITKEENDTIVEAITEIVVDYLSESLPYYNITMEQFDTYDQCPKYRCKYGDLCLAYCSNVTVDIDFLNDQTQLYQNFSIATLKRMQVALIDNHRQLIEDEMIVCSGDHRMFMMEVHADDLILSSDRRRHLLAEQYGDELFEYDDEDVSDYYNKLAKQYRETHKTGTHAQHQQEVGADGTAKRRTLQVPEGVITGQ